MALLFWPIVSVPFAQMLVLGGVNQGFQESTKSAVFCFFLVYQSILIHVVLDEWIVDQKSLLVYEAVNPVSQFKSQQQARQGPCISKCSGAAITGIRLQHHIANSQGQSPVIQFLYRPHGLFRPQPWVWCLQELQIKLGWRAEASCRVAEAKKRAACLIQK